MGLFYTENLSSNLGYGNEALNATGLAALGKSAAESTGSEVVKVVWTSTTPSPISSAINVTSACGAISCGAVSGIVIGGGILLVVGRRREANMVPLAPDDSARTRTCTSMMQMLNQAFAFGGRAVRRLQRSNATSEPPAELNLPDVLNGDPQEVQEVGGLISGLRAALGF